MQGVTEVSASKTQLDCQYSRRGKKALIFSRDKNARGKPEEGGGGGEKSLLCDPGSELRLHRRGWSRRMKGEHSR